jgi:hypothetical protein
MMSPRPFSGDLQGGIAPLFDRVEGVSDIQRMLIGRTIAGE